MPSRRILWAPIFAASLFGQTATRDLQVTDVRFWSLDGVTRVAIETTGEFTYKSDRIPNPDRLFFDISGARPRMASRKIAIKNVGDKLLKRIRIAENVPGVTRIVLDLENSVQFTASQLGNPDRLMVELRPIASSDVPAPAVQPPSLVQPPPPSEPTVISTAAKSIAAPVVAPLRPAPPLPARHDLAAADLAAINPGAANPARRLSADGTRSLTRALGLKLNRVVIDPGHGGYDQGTSGPEGLLEKNLVLDVALRLGKLIEQRMGSEVVYTRTDDTFIPLRDRTDVANQRKADLFLSIHANSSSAVRVAGIETYYLNFTSSSEALDLAARENAGSQNSVFDLSGLVESIAKRDKVEESKELAADVQAALQSFETKYQPAARDRGIRKAPFVVLIGAQMPSILAEIGFLSNPKEEALLTKPEHRQKLAEALYRGVYRYSQALSHFEISRKLEKGTDQPSRDEPSAK